LADHIANTSPLCYLHRAGILHVLPAILGRVIVPAQVVAELGAGRARGYDLPDPLMLPWADVRAVVPLASRLEPFGFLGAGERAALTLALALPGPVAIIDELPARRVASRLGVNVTGTLNVIWWPSNSATCRPCARSWIGCRNCDSGCPPHFAITSWPWRAKPRAPARLTARRTPGLEWGKQPGFRAGSSRQCRGWVESNRFPHRKQRNNCRTVLECTARNRGRAAGVLYTTGSNHVGTTAAGGAHAYLAGITVQGRIAVHLVESQAVVLRRQVPPRQLASVRPAPAQS